MKASDPNAMAALVERFGPNITESSAQCQSGPSMCDVLAGKHYGTIFEIGTYQGVSGAILAEHADRVLTLDLERYQRAIADDVWRFFGVEGKITRIIARGEDHKREVIGALDFDMCFLDGDHNRLNVMLDFILAKERCNCILFHDYPIGLPPEYFPKAGYNHRDYPSEGNGLDGVALLLDCVRPEGVIERIPPFAWWRKE